MDVINSAKFDFCRSFLLTINQKHSRNLIILHIYLDLTDVMDMEVVAPDFVSLNNFRAEFVWCGYN